MPDRLAVQSSYAIARQEQEPALSMSDRGGSSAHAQAVMKISDTTAA
jgi:hypothetical protein